LSNAQWRQLAESSVRQRGDGKEVGHAPMFLDAPQIDIVRNFLLA
jgi:hypothetical protein